MFHITGTVSMMHTSIVFGGTLVIMPRWDRDVAGRLISRCKVTSWTNIPTMVIDLLASPNFASYDLSSLSYIGGGGAAMPQAIAQRLLRAVRPEATSKATASPRRLRLRMPTPTRTRSSSAWASLT